MSTGKRPQTDLVLHTPASLFFFAFLVGLPAGNLLSRRGAGRLMRTHVKSTLRRPLRLLPLLLLLTGCGYHQVGSATHIPNGIHTLAVPIFATRVQAFRTEVDFTQAVVRELNTSTRYRI